MSLFNRWKNSWPENKVPPLAIKAQPIRPEASIRWKDYTNPYSLHYKPGYPYGAGSKAVLATLHPDLIFLSNMIADLFNTSAISGYRGEAEQTGYFKKGTGVAWPTSNHNVFPSLAVDLIPYPGGYEHVDQFDMMIGAGYAIAKQEGFKIRSGKFFSNMVDRPHFELVKS